MIDFKKNKNLTWGIITVVLIGILSAVSGIFPKADMTMAGMKEEVITYSIILESPSEFEEPVETKLSIIVHVVGAVQNPGVYELDENARVKDACEAAGGLTDKAAQKEVNMALRLSDGQQVFIPTSDEVSPKIVPQVEKRIDVTQSIPENSSLSNDSATLCVNINTAGLSEFTQLPGIGEVIGRNIIEYRDKNGPFFAPEDLINVSGIGESKLSKILPHVKVN